MIEQVRIESKEKALFMNKTKQEREKDEINEIRSCSYDLEPLSLFKPFIDQERFKV